MTWIKNTAGKPDSQLTLQTSWSVLGMVLVLFVVGRNTMQGLPVGWEVWAFVATMTGSKTLSYVRRRGQKPPDDMAG